jgi:CheY-like chemotaxis protein
MKVLVVEDDPFVREMAVTGLEEAGFEVTEGASGAEALGFLQAGFALDALLRHTTTRSQWLGGG